MTFDAQDDLGESGAGGEGLASSGAALFKPGQHGDVEMADMGEADAAAGPPPAAAHHHQQDVADAIQLRRYEMRLRYFRHLGLAIKKNFLLKSRKPCGCVCEVLLPPFFMMLLILGYQLASIDTISAAEYMQNDVFNTTDLIRETVCVDVNESVYAVLPNPVRFQRCTGGVFDIPPFMRRRQDLLDDIGNFQREVQNLQPPLDFTLLLDILARNRLTPDEVGTLIDYNPDLLRQVAKVTDGGEFAVVLADADVYLSQRNGDGPVEKVGRLAAVPSGSRINAVYDAFGRVASTRSPTDIMHFDAYFAMQKAVYTFGDSDQDRGRSAFLSLFHAGEMEFAYNKGNPKVECDNLMDMVRFFGNSTLMFNTVYNRTKLRQGNEHSTCPGVWQSEGAAEDYITTVGADNTWALLVINEYDAPRRVLDYTIRMNFTATPQTKNSVDPYSQGLGSHPHLQYVLSGFVSLQSLVFSSQFSETYLSGSGAGPTVPPVTLTTESSGFVQSPMATAQYRESEFFQRAGEALPLYLCFAFIYPVSRLVSAMVTEKEKRQREGMLIMGLNRSSFYSSWFWTYVVLTFCSAGLIVLITFGNLFQNSDPFLILLHFWLYGISLTAWSIMVSVLFSKARIAATVAPFLLIAFSIPSRMVGDRISLSEQRAISLLCPSAFGYASEVLTGYEGAGIGANFDNFNTTEYSILDGWMFLLLDTVLYLAIAWYLDHVFPSEWGVKLHPLFFVFPSFWLGRPDVKAADGNPDPRTPITEQYDADITSAMKERERIRITGLTKTFPNKPIPAVNQLGHGMPEGTISFYEGQIQCVLGHNGAGKTTLINMMTGMLAPDAGDCTIYGNSILNNMDSIRKDVGLCPQHNILWDDLTPREHLDFFGRLKGVPGDVLSGLADQMLDLVNLGTKKDAYAKTLSGGQKRKLSVAIALIGGSRLVFLDEPTAGMDVESRRAMWHLLRRPEILQDRIIVLTTHYMDEADLLGDNVIIMDQGNLHARGSPFFLKQKLGVGYNLSIVMRAGCNVGDLEARVKSHVPSATFLSCNGNELRLQLPLFLPITDEVVQQTPSSGDAAVDAFRRELLETPVEQRLEMITSKLGHVLAAPNLKHAASDMVKSARAQGVFPNLFEDLEDSKEQLGVESFGVGVTTLEEVFMKIALTSDHYAGTAGHTGEKKDVVGATNTDFKLYSITDKDSEPPISGRSLVVAQFAALFMKRFRFARRDKRTMFFMLILPVLCVVLAVGLGKIPLPGQPKTGIDISQFSSSPLQVPVSNSEEASRAGATYRDSINDVFASCDPSLPQQALERCYLKPPLFDMMNVTALNSSVGEGQELSLWLQDNYFAHGGQDRPLAYAVYDGSHERDNTSTVLLHNATWLHGLPTSVATLHNSILRRVYGGSATVRVANHPLPLSDYFQQFIKSIQVLLTGIVILLPFTILPSNYVAFVVKERECKAKTLQLVSGVKVYVYWFANFCFDLAAYHLTVFLVMMIFFADSRNEYIGDGDKFFGCFLLFLLYGISSIVCSYAVSFAFNVHTQAQTAVSVGNFITGFALVMAAYIMDEVESTQDVNRVLKYIFRCIPSFCLGEGIIKLAQHSSPVVEFALRPDDSVLEWEVLGVDLFYMSISIPLYVAIVMFAEYYREIKARLSARLDRHGATVTDRSVASADASSTPSRSRALLPTRGGFPEDPMVAKERDDVLASDSNDRKDDLVSVRHLTKVWPLPGINNHKTAVNDVTFGVKRGELFAFLGTNGAGKTTTLSCLSGEIAPTSGSATIAGFDIETETRNARRHLGFCPQFDALLEHLTVDEHLHLYSSLRGVPGERAKESVETLLNALGLQQFRTKEAKQLSGGNKRKLSVAIALIGGPPVIFLDEPSAGMDPVARRGLWSALEDACKNRCVVLTTHHLEEVEGLSHLKHRVTIMVDSKLQCMGSLQQVKSNFGDAYELEVKACGLPSVEGIRKFVARAYPASRLEEVAGVRLTFKIPMPLRLSEVFRCIESSRVELGITDYSISATSLEQVFVRVSERAQRAEEGSDSDDGTQGPTPSPRPLTVNGVDGGQEEEVYPVVDPADVVVVGAEGVEPLQVSSGSVPAEQGGQVVVLD